MPDVLYAARGGGSASQLYTLNPTTGAATAIGNIGYAITGLAIDPETDILYGSTSQSSPGGTAQQLITINTTTGAGSFVGNLDNPCTDIAFDRFGQLWGFNAAGGARGVQSIIKSTGVTTRIGSSISGYGGGCDFSRNSPYAFYGAHDGEESTLFTYNTTTGVATTGVSLSGATFPGDEASIAACAFHPTTNTLYAIASNFGSGTNLITINVSTGAITLIGNLAFTNFDGLAWSPAIDFAGPPSFCVLATDDPNTASTTVTVLGDAVREKQTYGVNASGEGNSLGDATASFYVRSANLPPPGKYTATIKFRRNTINELWTVFLKRNGLVIGPVHDRGYSTTASVQTTDLIPGPYTLETGKTETIPIVDGDEIEVCALTYNNGTPNGIELMQVCFFAAEEGGFPDNPLYPVDMDEPQVPLGGASFDSLYDDTFDHPVSKDMTVMPNGDVYVFYIHNGFTGGGIGASVKLRKWNGSSWSVVNDNVWGLGDPGPWTGTTRTQPQAWNACIINDGTDLYMACGIKFANSSNWLWHCWKYNVGASSLTELGTGAGQSYYPVEETQSFSPSASVRMTAGSFDYGRPFLAIAPNGDLWCSWAEQQWDSNFPISDFSGSAANLSGGTDGFNSIDGSNPAARDGSGNAVGTSAGISGSYATLEFGEEVPIVISSPNFFEQGVITLGTPPASGEWVAYEYRLSGQGTGSRNGYRISWNGDGTLLWQKIVAGVATTIHNWGNVFGTPSAGDKLGIMPTINAVGVYRQLSSTPTTWSYSGSSVVDNTYPTATAIAGISFLGTTGKLTNFRGGYTTRDVRACVFYWNGSAWVDSEYPLFPDGYRRNDGGQYINITLESSNESPVQLTFCQTDGPSNNPSVMFWTEHNQPIAPYITPIQEEIRGHYSEWNGSSWSFYKQLNTFDMFGDALYETSNVTGQNFMYNGWPWEWTLFNDGETPCMVGNWKTRGGAIDLVGFAKMATDGSGFFTDPVGNPDDVLKVNSGPFNGPYYGYMGCSIAIDSRGQYFLWTSRDEFNVRGHLLMRGADNVDVGTGTQWTYGAYQNPTLPWNPQSTSFDVIGVDGDDNIYVLTDIEGFTQTTTAVFKWEQRNVAWYGWSALEPSIYGLASLTWKHGD